MKPILMWIVAYLIPSALACAGGLLYRGHRVIQLIVIHVLLLVSIACSTALIVWTQVPTELNYSLYSVLLLILGVLLAIAILGRLGAGYALSAIIQEATIIAILLLLLPYFNIVTIILLVIPVFSLAHAINPARWQIKIPLTFAFGVGIVFLYLWMRDPLLNSALHVVVGTFSIRAGLIYAR